MNTKKTSRIRQRFLSTKLILKELRVLKLHTDNVNQKTTKSLRILIGVLELRTKKKTSTRLYQLPVQQQFAWLAWMLGLLKLNFLSKLEKRPLQLLNLRTEHFAAALI